MFKLETERLILREWNTNDLTEMHAINSDPEVMKYFPRIPSTTDTLNFINRMIDLQKKHQHCYFALIRKDNSEFIGFTGLAIQNFQSEYSPCTDIGWRIKKSNWNQGYAYEAALASLEYGINKLNLNTVHSIAPSVNTPSLNLMKKLNMIELEEFIHPLLIEHPYLKKCKRYIYKTH